ncbi:hypothetical protein ACFVZC_35500 [Streptomyces marokkonensis]|uniref:ATP-dependent DNA ligase family profile domain-containing protein n=1 Tax=Streptomyces marokkonensis TaxID=324855 RepID=A0ABW6QHL8_9ACTN
MLAAAVPDARLPAGWAAEVKWDGWRALLSWDAGRLVLRSRQGTPLADAFPEVRAGAAQLPDGTALDGELIVGDESGRLAFERLQGRIQRRGAGVARLAAEWPAHFVAFDCCGSPAPTRWPGPTGGAGPCWSVFAARRLSAPWALCPSTTDADMVREWLTWAAVGSPSWATLLQIRRAEPSHPPAPHPSPTQGRPQELLLEGLPRPAQGRAC